jgi:hypothetical protein
MEPRSQQEIIDEFMLSQETGTEVVDKVKIPALARFWDAPPPKSNIKTERVRIANLKLAYMRSRSDIAELLSCVIDHHPDIVGLEWRVGTDEVDILYVEGFQQKQLNPEERNRFIELLVLMLRSRKDMMSLKWEFGKPHVEISWIA